MPVFCLTFVLPYAIFRFTTISMPFSKDAVLVFGSKMTRIMVITKIKWVDWFYNKRKY